MTRIVQRILFLATGVVVALVLASSCALYLAVTGRSLPALRVLTGYAGRLFAGQRTELLKLDLRVLPTEGRLAGSASLAVRSLDDHRQRFYFLLNDGLHVRQVRVENPGDVSTAVNVYRMWLLTIVEVAQPIAKNDTLQLSVDYEGAPTSGPVSVASSVVNAQQVRLNAGAFWYPSDVQGFFAADVAITLPEHLTVVHNGLDETRIQRGELQQVRWTSGRPIPGLSLVAGPYALTAREADGMRYRVYLPNDVALEPQRVLRLMQDADRALTDRYGASGFKQVTMVVDRSLRRGFNDGSGLIGLSIRYFRDGDYGFGNIAHEIAHNWWGATVAENWLSPGTGGEWIVEGLAEFSSLLATETVYGTAAFSRRLAGDFFDPTYQTALANMSVLDNALAEATARDTIYRKGAYVAAMLRRTLGDEAYFLGLRQFLDRFRYRQATDADLQQALQDSSKQDLTQFFADWVRSDRLADLALDGSGQADVTVTNLGSAPVTGIIDLWIFKSDGGEPARTTVHVGDQFPLDSTRDYAVLDPLLGWADMLRENNRYPRRNGPVSVTVSAQGSVALTEGGGFRWARASVSSKAKDGRTEHTWDFDQGLAGAPAWSPDGAHLIVTQTAPKSSLPAIVTLEADGTRRTIGRGTAPAASADGSIYAGAHDRIVRVAPDGRMTALVQREGESLDVPVPSPDGTSLVYTAARGNHMALRQVGRDGRADRLIVASDRDRTVYRWSKDGSRLYAIVGGDWDWQIWEIPVATEPIRVLARGAAAIADLAVSPDGSHLAFTAVPSLDYPDNRHELYVADLGNRTVRTIDVPDADLTQLAWVDADSLLVVAEAAGSGHPWILPGTRVLKRIRPADGSVEDAK